MRAIASTIFAAGLLVALGHATFVRAQEEPPAGPLRGTLGKVSNSGVIGIGYREASFPFSYLGANNNPIGYSLDLCMAIVDEIGRAIDKPQVHTRFTLVTPETRIPTLLSGKVDLVCGSATGDGHQADGQTRFRVSVDQRSQGQDRCRDRGHDQRASDQGRER
jgi:ABC-type amino acid transport substrate-binding protein